VTSAEAQGRLAELLESVDEGPVAITREGRPDAFLVSATEIDELVEARRRNQAVAHWKAPPGSLEGGGEKTLDSGTGGVDR